MSGARRPGRAAMLAWAGLAMLGALGIGVLLGGVLPHRSSPVSSAADVEPGVDAAAASVLGLDVLSPPYVMAPDFTLTDQAGRTVSLADFRGKAVVLSFNDDECQDLCTLLAQSVVKANQDLGAAADDVEFLSVNANPLHPAVKDVAAWTDDHGLGSEGNWSFVTGDPDQLAQVADDYHVSISVDPDTGEVVHGTEMFFLDPTGAEVAVGEFGTQSANTAEFAYAMARMAEDLLPPDRQAPVAGRPRTPPGAAATIGDPAPSIALPSLADPSSSLVVAGVPGKYTVVNFWASTCALCVEEMPALEEAHQALGDGVAFLGVDVADAGEAARAFASRAGVTYPLAVDARGEATGAYGVAALPYTVIVGPDGALVVRHPGTFTAEQLEYVVRTLEGE